VLLGEDPAYIFEPFSEAELVFNVTRHSVRYMTSVALMPDGAPVGDARGSVLPPVLSLTSSLPPLVPVLGLFP
jgi:hypothetical protein